MTSQRTEAGRASTLAAVAHSQLVDSRAAGQEAARAALDRLGRADCSLVFLYATAAHDPVLLQAGVRDVVGNDARVVGGQTVGVITSDRVAEEGFEVGVAVLAAGTLEVRAAMEPDVSKGEFDAGRRLAHALTREAPIPHDAVLLLTYDIVLQQTGTVWSMNLAGPFLDGMSSALPDWPTVIGGGMTGDNNFSLAVQWADDHVATDAAMGVVISGGLRADTTILHGCAPTSRYHTVTRAEGVEVIEIDGRPALDVIYEVVGPNAASDIESFPMMLTLGVNHGDLYGQFREEDYVICVCRGVDTERRRLVMYNDDLVEGTQVQLMRRHIDFDDVRARTRQLVERLDGRKPVLALYADCWARRSVMCGTNGEDAEIVRQALGDDVPLLGFYVGSEITRVGGRARATNYTGLLTILSE